MHEGCAAAEEKNEPLEAFSLPQALANKTDTTERIYQIPKFFFAVLWILRLQPDLQSRWGGLSQNRRYAF